MGNIYNIADARYSIININTKEIKIPRSISFQPVKYHDIVGRDKELANILNELNSEKSVVKKNFVINTGIGGVGKTALARLVGTKMLERKNQTVLFLSVLTSDSSFLNVGIPDILANNKDLIALTQTIKDAEIGARYDIPKDAQQRYLLIKNTLQNLNSPKLLILDDVTKDWLVQNRSRINSDFGDWHILATSRDSGDYEFLNFKRIILDNLTKENAINLFKKILTEYQTNLPDESKIEKLIEILGGHALSVTFFARLLGQDLDLDVDQVLDKLKQGLTFEHCGVDIEYRNLTQTQVETVMKLALDLARLDQFTETQRTYLRHFSILPAEFIDYKKYKEILELSLEDQENKDKFKTIQEDFKILTKYGFLEKQKGSYKMHKVMQKAIRAELKVIPENIKSCGDLVVGLIRHFKFSGTNKDYTLLFKDLELGSSVTNYFLEGWQKENQNTENLKKYENLATLINNLALVYDSQGKYPEAEELYKQALEIGKKTIGEEHPEYAKHLNNLALVYRSQGRYPEAEKLYKQALEIGKKTIGQDHPNYAIRLNNLAGVYNSQGKYPEAEKLYKQALEIGKKTIGEDHPNYAIRLNNLASIYQFQGKYPEAEELYKQAIEIDKKTIGEGHPEYAICLNNLASIYQFQGKYPEAEELYKQALEIRLKKLGEDHPDTQNTQIWLDIFNRELGE